MYDKSNKDSILKYAKKLVGKTFSQIHQEALLDNTLIVQEQGQNDYSTALKGSYGHIIEKDYFGLTINNESRPDFEEAGVELKVSPIIKLKNKQIRAGERLVISMIPFNEEIEVDFEKSSVFSKINHILFILYLRDKVEFLNRFEYPIKYVDLFSFYRTLSIEDQKIIKQDYQKIQTKIEAGLAHELSEGDTLYLGACTKGKNSKSSYRVQYKNEGILAKGRAFSFKQSFFSRLINEHIINKQIEEEKIINDVTELDEKTFEEIVDGKIQKFIGLDKTVLESKFNLNSKAKNFYSLLAFRMLGISSNSAEEFSKAGIVVKTIRIEEDNSIKEHMSFPNINIKKFSEELWETSDIYQYYRETKFLFMIFKNVNGQRVFKGAQFWNMPINDLENIVIEDWQKTQKVILDGVKFKVNKTKIENNIPGAEETNIFHLRPKAQGAAYKIRLSDGIYEKGNIKSDGDILPNGDIMTKLCHWLNKEYIIKQLDQKFFD